MCLAILYIMLGASDSKSLFLVVDNEMHIREY